MKWPVYFADNLAVGDENHSVAVCCLWSKREPILHALAPSDYAVVGNLYSRDGINYLLRNVLANPRLRTLLVVGRDNTGTGESLVRLFREGMEDDHRIAGDGTLIHAEIPRAVVDFVREKVHLIDRRDLIDPQAIAGLVRTLPRVDEPFSEAPLLFPYTVPQPTTLPSEDVGFVVRGRLVAEVWLRLVGLVLQFGKIDRTQHSVDQKELLDVVAVVTEEDPSDIFCPAYLPCSKSSLEAYYDCVLRGDLPSAELSYTYGSRLFNYEGIDQVEAMIRELSQAAHSRRATAVLWDPRRDPLSPHPPCLDLVQARVRDARLFLTAYFRSHDIFRAWPENAFALRKLQERVAARLEGVTLGELVLISHSAHIYEDCWANAVQVWKERDRSAKRNQRDPRGNFVIRLEADGIVVEHYGPDEEHLGTYRGRTGRDLEPQLAPLTSTASHGLYLGRELAKAEIAFRTGVPYTQDQNLPGMGKSGESRAQREK